MDNVDVKYIWQRRFHHGMRFQKSAVPFPNLVEIGLDFNMASKRKEKLDAGLLTNGVMLDICDFAKCVTKAEKYMVCEILEFNFDLGMDDDKQRYEFATRVYRRAKQMRDAVKLKRPRWKDVFVLPDPKTFTLSTVSELSSLAKLNEISEKSGAVDADLNLTSSEHQKADSNGENIIHKPPGPRLSLPEHRHPYSKRIGLALDIRPKDTPKQKLDPKLLTNIVMIEVLNFAKVLRGTHTQIVLDVLEHNFGLGLNKTTIHQKISKLIQKRNSSFPASVRVAFRKEPFIFRAKTTWKWKRRFVAEVDSQALETAASKKKRRRKQRECFGINSTGNILGSREACWQESDLSYQCPVDTDTEMQSDPEAEQESMKMEGCLFGTAAGVESAASLDVKQEEEDIPLSPGLPWSNSRCRRSYTPDSYNATQEAISGLFSKDTNGGLNVETAKLKLWRRRAARSKQILSTSCRVKDTFPDCRKMGLDFNVDCGGKQNINLQLLTNGVLFEVYNFAHAMTRAQGNFTLDILERNFFLDLQDELHHHNFLFYITTKLKALLNHPCKNTEFLSSVFELPEIHNMVSVTSDFPLLQDVLTEQPTSWDPLSASATSQEASMEPFPFCNQLGVNLWSVEDRPISEKLDLSLLTNGAMLEVVSFAKELCGTVWQITHDVLEHNFDLDLQSGKTKVAQHIQKWYVAQKYLKKTYSTTIQGSQKWLNTIVRLTPRSRRAPMNAQFRRPGPNGSLFNDRKEEALTGVEYSSYPLCQEIGLDLNIGSKSKAKLDLQVLTRAVVYEVHRSVVQNPKVQYVPALFKILEYNFDLSSLSHRRWEFALSIASQVKAIVGKYKCSLGKKTDYPNKVFELPFELSSSAHIVCKEEPENDFGDLDLDDDDDIVFVRELIPVDIDVELE